MKTLHLSIIIIIGAVAVMGIYVLLPHLQSSFPVSYVNLELVGIYDTYNTNQVIKFQFKATGYGIPCAMPEITIYKSDQPSVIVFEKKFPPLMCPIEDPTFFNVVYPSKNDTYSLAIRDASKYTIHVLFLNNEIKKEFEIK
ncbi:MAG: hypothetical protein KGH99_00970 [Thaumarchaeota archaeon]|nr:hypothetical protein [Candidatus Nitrosotalea sp.]MDE1872031.1 hypothetical protein [Nitrososphaerota archaeon]